jgi:hypothetical protein
MKQAIFIIFLALTACKKTTPPVTPNTPPQAIYHTVPNWASDTLYSFGSGLMDTMYAYTDAGKSYIKHKGVQYELKAYEVQHQVYSDSLMQYYVDVFDGSGIRINPNNTTTMVSVSKYWQNGWKPSLQMIICKYAPFDVNAHSYQGLDI